MGWIDRNWDHGMLLWERDPAIPLVEQTPAVPGGSQRLFKMPYNPTGENIAKYLGEVVCPTLFADSNIAIVKIVIYETENGIAEWASDTLSRPIKMCSHCDYAPSDLHPNEEHA